MTLEKEILKIAQNAKESSRILACLSTKIKDRALEQMANNLVKERKFILKENKKDLALIKGKPSAFKDRLSLNDQRIEEMAQSLREISNLADPIGSLIKQWRRPNGLIIRKVRVPIGVISIIYESRPNVTSDCIGLCLKSGNAVILRGGSEALNSNIAIYKILKEAAVKCGIPKEAINLITTPKRKAVKVLLGLNDYIDLVMPRGGEGLIKEVSRLSRIPVIKHYKGICHTYVDSAADLEMALEVCFNAKVQRPGVCNAMETLLVHQDVAWRFLPRMIREFKDAGVEIRGCSRTQRIVKGIKKAKESDWSTEYLALILSVKVVDNLEEAIEHINKYSSHHSDSIITRNDQNAFEFLNRIDSACVYHNASTRFTDGYQFGFGAEIGISTDKLHARGPMALEELTTYKYIVFGNGQIRE